MKKANQARKEAEYNQRKLLEENKELQIKTISESIDEEVEEGKFSVKHTVKLYDETIKLLKESGYIVGIGKEYVLIEW